MIGGLLTRLFFSAPSPTTAPIATALEVNAAATAKLERHAAATRDELARLEREAADVEASRPALLAAAAMGAVNAAALANEKACAVEMMRGAATDCKGALSEFARQVRALHDERARLEGDQLAAEGVAAQDTERDAAVRLDKAGQAFAAALRVWLEASIRNSALQFRLTGRQSLSIPFRLENALSSLLIPTLPRGVLGLDVSTTAARRGYNFSSFSAAPVDVPAAGEQEHA